MAAPTPIVRQMPTGQRMDDGYQSLIAFEDDPDILFWEKGITPPGLDGGEAIPTTTMHNTVWRTFSPMALITLTPMTTRVAWDVDLYTEIEALINDEQSISVHLPSGQSYSFFGFLQRFEPGELVEGTQPEATITIVPTNYDPVNGVEAAPVVGS